MGQVSVPLVKTQFQEPKSEGGGGAAGGSVCRERGCCWQEVKVCSHSRGKRPERESLEEAEQGLSLWVSSLFLLRNPVPRVIFMQTGIQAQGRIPEAPGSFLAL